MEEPLKEKKTPPASIAQACSEVAILTGVKLKPTQMRHYIKRLGAGYRKVCGIPAEVDTNLGGQDVDTWYKKYREKIIKWLYQNTKKEYS